MAAMKRLWIKLYIEILDDAKMGRLPDWLWRRAVELFLIAGENGDDGILPPEDDLVWRLRLDRSGLLNALRALQELGIVKEAEPEHWIVCNFKERQYSESYERVKRYRNRYSNEESNADETRKESPLLSSSSTSDSREEEVQEEGKVFQVYAEHIGELDSRIRDELGDLIDEYSAEWVITALEKSSERGKRSLPYAKGCLRGWKKDGLVHPPNGRAKGTGKTTDQVVQEVAGQL